MPSDAVGSYVPPCQVARGERVDGGGIRCKAGPMSSMQKAEKSERKSWFQEEVMNLLPDLMSGALAMADTRSDAEDLVADAVARAWERLDDLRDRDRLRGWIFCIMRNCFLARRRSRSRRPVRVSWEEVGCEEADFSLFDRLHQPFLLWWGNPEEQFLNRLLSEDLQEAVRDVPEPYRAVVILADVQGFKYSEIADALEIPVGTVRSRLARGRSHLQKRLWDHAVDAGIQLPGSPNQGATE
jgi:RNA polymerase sigma-70 factor, ECF subfamily